MKVLAIEANERVIRDISLFLKVRYPEAALIPVGEWAKGVETVDAESLDLVVLDSSLPDRDAPDRGGQIGEFSGVLLIILPEAQTDPARSRVLEAGGDDCVCRPFNLSELLPA